MKLNPRPEIAAAHRAHSRVHATELVGKCYFWLVRAICRLDPDSGARLAVYAMSQILAAAQAFILHNRLQHQCHAPAPALASALNPATAPNPHGNHARADTMVQ